MKLQSPILIALDYYDGYLSGFAVDIPAHAGACRFQCIAWDGGQDERLYTVAPVDRSAVVDACSILGELAINPTADALSEKQSKALDQLLLSTELSLSGVGATLVFGMRVDAEPSLTCSALPFRSRVAAAVRAHTPEDLSGWEDVRRYARKTSAP